MDIHSILQYFQNYESEIKFQQSSLRDVKGYDYSIEVLENPERLEEGLLQQKVNYLTEIINSKKSHICRKNEYREDKKLNEIIKQIISRHEEELLSTALDFKNDKTEKEFIIELRKIVDDQSCYICYPVLEKDKNYHPLFVFEATLLHGEISVKTIHANLNALSLYIACFTNTATSEVTHAYGEKIESVLRQIENLHVPEKMDEALYSAITVINGEFPNLFSAVGEFKKYEGWSRLSTVFVTTESFKKFNEPPFRTEIELVQRNLKDKGEPTLNSNPLNSYLLGNNHSVPFDRIKPQNHFHLGSYTDAYSINEKQWHILGALNNSHLLSVNGPPGTGKTTLLKEIIADTIVKKAQQLVGIWDEKWEPTDNGKMYISPMKGKNDHSIVVTSTNNKAVDNIGEELMSEVSYFSQFVKDMAEDDLTIKGLMCARLGKKSNVDQFRRNILEPLINGLKSTDLINYEDKEEQTLTNFNKTIADLESIEQTISTYLQITKDCLNQGLLDKKYGQSRSQEQLEHQKDQLSISMEQLRYKQDEISQKVESHQNNAFARIEEQEMLQKDIFEIENKQKEYYSALEEFHSYSKIKWLSFLPKRKKFFKNYPSELFIRERIEKLDSAYFNKQSRLDKCKQSVLSIQHNIQSLEKEFSEISENYDLLKEQLNKTQANIRLLKRLELVKEQLVQQLKLDLDPEKYDSVYDLIHSNDIIAKKRHVLFKQSLLVIEHYIWKHREEILNNLEYISGKDYLFQPFYSKTQKFHSKKENELRVAWETFFICFPVVTTTLHSFKSTNFHMLEGYIDLLLVDESGQVLPHYLVGPLYRVKRALVVGDIMQIAPVRPTMNNIIEQSNIPEDNWNLFDITKKSAQHYADQNSDVFEIMDKQRVGIILEEHRRCEPAIAAFSNHKVYNNRLKIVKKDNNDKLFGNNLIGIDIRGKQESSNVNKQEATICGKIVKKMIERYGETIKDEIGIITPFKNQKKYLEKIIKDVDIGTVHAFQGQEKKYIIFTSVVNEKLIEFVGGEPNLLNVAITRGKEQFIFVGNFEAALRSGNYLSSLLNMIKKYGAAFSLFNTDLNISDTTYKVEVFQMFAASKIDKPSEFGSFLYEKFPNHVIIGAKSHYYTLINALAKSEKSIDIISPWLASNLINGDQFNRGLTYAMGQENDIHIIFGYNKRRGATLERIESIYHTDVNKKFVDESSYVNAVINLRKKLKGGLEYRPPLHVKLLLVDKQYLIIGSHNWLSNDASQSNAKEEISVILTDKEYIDYVVDYFKL